MVNGSAFDSSTIRELVKVMDDQIPEATSLNSRNFLMPIGNIVKVADNQTSIKGKVERGILAKGKRVSIIANGKNEDIVVKEIKKAMMAS